MSIEETGQAADTSSKPAPLLRTLGDPAAAVCVDGFCAVPEIDVVSGIDTNTTNTDTTNTNTTNTNTTNTSGADK